MPCGMNLEAGWEPIRRVLRSLDADADVHVEDAIRLTVRVLPILDDASMLRVLRETLRDQGWTEQPDGALTREVDGAVAALAPDGRSVTLTRAQDATVAIRAEVSVAEDADAERTRRALEREAARKLASEREAATRSMARENTAALAALEPRVRAELQDALNRTYRRALEERARQLGEVESVQESGDPGGAYEVKIVVRA